MRECSRIFFALFIFVFGFAGSGMCGIGSRDTRRVVNWSEEKYRPFVRLDNGVNLCTAQYISENLIFFVSRTLCW